MLIALALLLVADVLAQDSCVSPDLQAATTMAREAVFAGSASEVGGVVSQAEQGLGCLERWTSPDELAAFFQAAGAVSSISLDRAAAQRRFGAAARLAGGVPFDRSLGLVHEPVYSEVAAQIADGPRGTLAANTDVRVDGWILRLGEQRSVPAGDHLVQHTDASGRVVSEWVAVASGGASLVGPIPPPVEAPCAEPALSRPVRISMVSAGGVSLAAGVGLLVLGGSQLHELGRAKGAGMTPDEQAPLVRSARLSSYGGLAATAVGAGLLLTPAIRISGGELELGMGPAWWVVR